MRKFLISWLWGFSCFSFFPASAAVITRDISIDLIADGSVYWVPSEERWQGDVGIEDTTLMTGDTLLLNVSFANSKSLRLSNPGGNPFNDSVEDVSLFLTTSEASGMDYRASGTLTYVGVNGGLLINPIDYSLSGGGGALAFHNYSNLTDTNFSYAGFILEMSFVPTVAQEEEFVCRTGFSCVFDTLTWIASAENVDVVSVVPVPATAWLFLSGIVFLGWRKKKA